jgi:hypothetical protein
MALVASKKKPQIKNPEPLGTRGLWNTGSQRDDTL